MQTEIIKTKTDNINIDGIKKAAEILRAGGLVAIPTETVYGLAADALDADAVSKIFLAKGRPQDNPLIVHISDKAWLEEYACEIPDTAYKLIEAFWPGPLTIILKKKSVIPDAVSAGLDTAAFRMPSHPVAAAIIKEAGIPLAAPSANTSGRPSPTRAQHVIDDLDGLIDAIVDGGSCGVGVESTVVALVGGRPRILRPGGITPAQIESVTGNVEIDSGVLERVSDNFKAASPGMKYKHYAPKAKITIVKGELHDFVAYVNSNKQDGLAVLCFDGEERLFDIPTVTYGSESDSESQAMKLFDSLRRLDEISARVVYARGPNENGVGLAVYNRLLRAAGFDIYSLR